jgi:glycosyltransferase involved in cell wall biosynthesis
LTGILHYGPTGKMNKILHITLHLNPGGRENLIVHLSNKLNELGHLSSIACLKHSGSLSKFLAPETKIYEFNKKNELSIATLLKLYAFLKKNPFDIVHCHNPGTLFYGCISGKLAGTKKIINTEHGFVDKYSKKSLIKDYFLLSLASKTTVVSESIKQELINRHKINSSKINIVKNGIYKKKSFKSRSEVLSLLGLNDNHFYIGVVARLTPIKNHKLLIDAFVLLSSKYPNLRLLIIGGGETENEIKLYSNLVKDKVYFLGPRDDVFDILQVIDIFVLPSNSEGLSLAIMEAMSAGLPIVATDVGGNRELIQHNYSGILTPPKIPSSLADAIEKLILNRNFRKHLGQNAMVQFNKHFTINKMANSFLNLYE